MVRSTYFPIPPLSYRPRSGPGLLRSAQRWMPRRAGSTSLAFRSRRSATGRGRGAPNVTPPAPPDPSDPPAPEAAPAETADPFVAWLFGRAGLSAAAYRPETLRRRLPACLRALRARSPAHARQLLERTPSLVTA